MPVYEYMIAFAINGVFYTLLCSVLVFLWIYIILVGDVLVPFFRSGADDISIEDKLLSGFIILSAGVLLYTYMMLYFWPLSYIAPFLIFLSAIYLFLERGVYLIDALKLRAFYLYIGSFLLLMMFQFSPYIWLVITIPSDNFLRYLPNDYVISLKFAQAMRDGELLVFSDWLGSDRPPLLSGFITAFSIPLFPLHVSYTVVGTALQLLIVPISALIVKKVSRPQALSVSACILFLCMATTPLFIHNISYLWPKIFSAIYILIAIYFIFIAFKPSWPHVFLCAMALACAFLSHGGSAYAIIGIGLLKILFLLRSELKNRQMWVYHFGIFVGFIIVNIPWSLYKQFVQPPGDRLTKWHLLDETEVTDTGFLELASQKYDGFLFGDLLERIRAGVTAQFYQPFLDVYTWLTTGAQFDYFNASFFATIPSIGYLTVPLLILVMVWYRDKLYLTLLAVWATIFGVWLTLPFKGAMSVHEGTYILQILPFIILAYGINKLVLKQTRTAWIFVTLFVVQALLQLGAFWDMRWSRDFPVVPKALATVETVSGSNGGTDFYRTRKVRRAVLGTFVESDADTATVSITASNGSGVYYRTGPSADGQSLTVTNAAGDILIRKQGEIFEEWTMLTFPHAEELHIELVDAGEGWGQWSAVELAGVAIFIDDFEDEAAPPSSAR